MSAVFLKILNMSITASWLIAAAVLIRPLLKKAPKWISCLLWALVAIRLVCPFSFESVLSLIPSSQTIPTNIAVQSEPQIDSGITAVNDVINPVITEWFAPATAESVNPLQIIIPIAAYIWIAGIIVLLAFALISYIKLNKTVSVCVPVREGVLACDEIKAPFILGVFRPVIYVPSSMNGETLDYVVRHETAHLKRHDHWWKPLGFLLLAVYWFNPLCWIAYILLCRDIEMACDEKVVRDMDKYDIAGYSQALLDCSFQGKRMIAACPLAFGEVGVKERVRSVLNYRKPALWIIVAALVICVVVVVFFLADPKEDAPDKLPAIYPHSYEIEEVIYEALGADITMVSPDGELPETPMYAVSDAMRFLVKYSSDEWTALGTLEETELTKANFDELFKHKEAWLGKGSVSAVRKDTVNAWVLIYDQDILYYILQQKNGDVYLALCYYDYWEKSDPYSDDTHVRWLFKLTYANAGQQGANSGNDSPAGKYCIKTIDGKPAEEQMLLALKEQGMTSEEYLKATGLKSLNEAFTIELGKDGTAVQKAGNVTQYTGTWKQEGDTIIFTTAAGETRWTLKGKELIDQNTPQSEWVFAK